MRPAINAVRRPTLGQLYQFVQQVERAAGTPPITLSTPSTVISRPSSPTLHHLLTSSSSFLSSYLPPRLYHYHHAHHYHHYHPLITSLPSFSSLSQCFHRLSRTDEWLDIGGAGQPSPASIARFSAWSKQSMDELETVVRTVTHELRDLIRSGHSSLQDEVNRLLNTTYSLLIEMRLHLSHYHYVDAVYTEQERSKGAVDAKQVAYDFPVVSRVDVERLIESTIDDAKGACVEKYGDAPDVEVQVKVAGEGGVTMLAVAAHLHFIVMEVLKNSMKSLIDQHGVLNLHNSPPITIQLSSTPTPLGSTLGLILSDSGVGLSSLSPPSLLSPSPLSLFHYFFTTSSLKQTEDDADWRYSRAFGSPFTGLGVGLPLCRLYSEEVYGGGLGVGWVPGLTQVMVVLNQMGRVEVGRREH